MTTDPPTPRGDGWRVVRLAGRVCFAAGFMLVVFGLTQHKGFVVNAGLGLLLAAIVATGFSLYQHIKLRKSDR
ncbi:MAG: hypothetical protein ABIO65_11515 [Nitrospiria bacterium]